MGSMLKKEVQELEIVIVPVFDGMGKNQMDSSVREWLCGDMPGVLDDLPGGLNNNDHPDPVARRKQVEVRMTAQRWWYYCLTNPADPDDDQRGGERPDAAINRMSAAGLLTSDEKQHSSQSSMYLHFHMCPILKRTNHRKHNSHHWFFEGICCGLNTNIVLLTDCSTSYRTSCLAKLVYALITRRSDVIAVTGRMRAETPSRTFHPCQNSKLPFLRYNGEHEERGSLPCWKCYVAYYFSVGPMQGFEMEACQIINSSVYNMVEAMPVLPGPCQMMNWPKIRDYKVVEEYFELLFNEDRVEFGATRCRKRHLPSIYVDSSYANEERQAVIASEVMNEKDLEVGSDKELKKQNRFRRSSTRISYADIYSSPSLSSGTGAFETNSPWSEVMTFDWQPVQVKRTGGLEIRGAVASAPAPPDDASVDPASVKLSFTEFLRMHLRLAEDRILSFVSVFCTGYGTKCVQDAIFYYEPEVSFDMILKQRRRWVNGTVAGFFFFFFSKRAMMHIVGGFFDSHKVGKSLTLVLFLWMLNLIQFMFCFIAPALIGVTFYNAVGVLLSWSSEVFMGMRYSDSIYLDNAGAATGVYLLVYATWCYHSYFQHPTELYAFVMFLVGFMVQITILIALFSAASVELIHYLAICIVTAPLFLAATQTFESALLYLFYFPYFILFAGFYLIFLPAYSFARLWDTTWGNRLTGADASLSNLKTILLKKGVLLFNIFLVTFNVFLTVLCCMHLKSETIKLATVFIIFCPTFIQFIGSVFYIFLATPLRRVFGERSNYAQARTMESFHIPEDEDGDTETPRKRMYTIRPKFE